jgi:hypothetical protein
MALDSTTLAWLVALAAVAGLVRGFAGFGGALIFVPLASAMIGPLPAAVMLWLMDTLPSLPIALPALRRTEWRTIIPVAVGSALTTGLGVWWLKAGDPVILRWTIAGFIFASVAVLWSGWRYDGPRPLWASLSVGGLSGFFGGAAQVSGPPVLIYWLAGAEPAALIRANVISLFTLTTVSTGIIMALGGLFSWPVFLAALWIAPAYALALVIGQHFFGLTTEANFRRIAFGLILLAGFAALPVFDRVLR